MIIARKYRLTTLVCLALLGVAQASATGVGKTASEKLEATAIHSLAAAEQVALGAPPGTSAASNDTLYLLSLLPPWVELQDIDRVDFILPVIIEGENVATVFALDADIFWFQQGEEPLVLPPTGLEPPLRLLVADILPGAGNELIVAGGASMVAGSMPPSNWTPVGADAPGRIDAVPDESNDLLFFAAINGDLWLYDQETASWQAGLTFDGQPDQITALAAPLLAHSFLLAWDGSVLHGLHLEPDGAEGLNLIWKPFPVQPSFTVLSLSVLSGMFGNASAFATSGDSVFIINLSEADSGVGWKGPFTDAREITAMTRWQDIRIRAGPGLPLEEPTGCCA